MQASRKVFWFFWAPIAAVWGVLLVTVRRSITYFRKNGREVRRVANTFGIPAFTYLTIDATNAATAQELADRHAVPLNVAEPRDLSRLEREEARIVLDWDFLPDYRAKLLNGSAAKVVALHGFQIPDSVASFLPRRGIIVSRRLDDYLFQALAGLAKAA